MNIRTFLSHIVIILISANLWMKVKLNIVYLYGLYNYSEHIFIGIKMLNFIPLSQQGAHLHCKYGHQNVMLIFLQWNAHIHLKYWHREVHINVNIGIRVPIFA